MAAWGRERVSSSAKVSCPWRQGARAWGPHGPVCTAPEGMEGCPGGPSATPCCPAFASCSSCEFYPTPTSCLVNQCCDWNEMEEKERCDQFCAGLLHWGLVGICREEKTARKFGFFEEGSGKGGWAKVNNIIHSIWFFKYLPLDSGSEIN
jgi:hypothetical protein